MARQKPARKAPRRRALVGALALAALAAIVVLWLGGGTSEEGVERALRDRPARMPRSPGLRPDDPPRPAPGTSALPPVPAGTKVREVMPGVFEITPPPTPHDPQAEARFRERMRHAADIYQKYSAHPPWSRPFDESQRHLLEWNPPSSHAQPVASDDEGEIHAEAVLDRMFAGPGEAVTAQVTAWRVGAGGARVAVDYAVRGEIRVYDESRSNPARETAGYEPGWVKVADVAFVQGADPKVRTASFVPSQVPVLAAGPRDAEVVAWVHAAGNMMPFSLRFRYASVPPFVVLGKGGDRIEDGSLEVDLQVRALEPGPVRVTGVLFDAAGQTPIAIYDDYLRLAAAGDQVVKITFFGLAIREKGVDGPYSVRALHGHVLRNELEVFWKHDGVLTTNSYKASDFTDAEWWDPEREDKLESYDKATGD